MRRERFIKTILLLAFSFVPQAALVASEIRFAGIFTDHAVLQREVAAPIWGWGDPGEEVTLTFAGQTKTTKGDDKGKWMICLDPMPASTEGRELTVQSTSEDRKAKLTNILVGDVWLCSGQSNMAWSMGGSIGVYPVLAERLSKANNPLLRLCGVPYSCPPEALSDVAAPWQPANPRSAHHMSAIGYLFGERIQKETGIPIGIINSSRGSTLIENWTQAEIVEGSALYETYINNYRIEMDRYPALKPKFDTELADFQLRFPTKESLAAENQVRKVRGETMLQAPAEPRGPNHQNRPGALFNGMIAPILPYSLKGVLWYQGEANVWDFADYDQKMVTMIRSWRGLWGQANLPYLMTELAPFNKHSSTHQDSARCRFGVALAKGAVEAGNAWTITITDAGEEEDIHPRHKEIPADRFAARALAEVYGKAGISHGPVLKSWKAEGDKAVLTFDSVGQGLEARGVTLDQHKLTADILLGFEIADKDHNFFRAKAEVRGIDTVVVSSTEVLEPAAVRYAWADFPLCNLYNKEGFATYPFRTDDWPWKTPQQVELNPRGPR
jgi:sialate O-acetylesterase